MMCRSIRRWTCRRRSSVSSRRRWRKWTSFCAKATPCSGEIFVRKSSTPRDTHPAVPAFICHLKQGRLPFPRHNFSRATLSSPAALVAPTCGAARWKKSWTRWSASFSRFPMKPWFIRVTVSPPPSAKNARAIPSSPKNSRALRLLFIPTGLKPSFRAERGISLRLPNSAETSPSAALRFSRLPDLLHHRLHQFLGVHQLLRDHPNIHRRNRRIALAGAIDAVLAHQHQRIGQAVQSHRQPSAFLAEHLFVVLQFVLVFSKCGHQPVLPGSGRAGQTQEPQHRCTAINCARLPCCKAVPHRAQPHCSKLYPTVSTEHNHSRLKKFSAGGIPTLSVSNLPSSSFLGKRAGAA